MPNRIRNRAIRGLVFQFIRQIVPFNVAAKQIHSRYGISAKPAGRRTSTNRMSVTPVERPSSAISMRAMPSQWNEKKKNRPREVERELDPPEHQTL
jgi:hypothetical protein